LARGQIKEAKGRLVTIKGRAEGLPSEEAFCKQEEVWSRRFPVTEEALQERTGMKPSFPRHRGSILQSKAGMEPPCPVTEEALQERTGIETSFPRHRGSIARKNRYGAAVSPSCLSEAPIGNGGLAGRWEVDPTSAARHYRAQQPVQLSLYKQRRLSFSTLMKYLFPRRDLLKDTLKSVVCGIMWKGVLGNLPVMHTVYL
jgi:hypothetical protein